MERHDGADGHTILLLVFHTHSHIHSQLTRTAFPLLCSALLILIAVSLDVLALLFVVCPLLILSVFSLYCTPRCPLIVFDHLQFFLPAAHIFFFFYLLFFFFRIIVHIVDT